MEVTDHKEGAIETRKNELRQKIWTCSAHVPRNVDLLIKKGNYKAEIARGLPPKPEYKIISRCPQPALLSACQESRYLGLKYYKLEFGIYNYQPSTPNTNAIVLEPPRVYVNWSADRLCLINAAASSFYHEAAAVILERAGIMKAKSVAVNVHPRMRTNVSFSRNLARFAIKADADEILLVCQAPMSNRHAMIDSARRTNWGFKDFNAIDHQNQQHNVLKRFDVAFQLLMKIEGMNWKELQGSSWRDMMSDTVVRTRIRTCNECPQMVYVAAAEKEELEIQFKLFKAVSLQRTLFEKDTPGLDRRISFHF